MIINFLAEKIKYSHFLIGLYLKREKGMQRGKLKVVDGNISAGKSIFCKRYKSLFPDVYIFIEPSFENPFLDDYYNDPKNMCFKIEEYLINKRIKTYKKALKLVKEGKNVLLDRSIFSSIYFLNLNYFYEKNLSKNDYNTLITKCLDFIKNNPFPDENIALIREPSSCFETIRKRNGKIKKLECECLIKLNYLHNLDTCIRQFFNEFMNQITNCRMINWEKFDNGIVKKEFYKKILNFC
jgi:deoxyadenosine/deoxycytidine kinase